MYYRRLPQLDPAPTSAGIPPPRPTASVTTSTSTDADSTGQHTTPHSTSTTRADTSRIELYNRSYTTLSMHSTNQRPQTSTNPAHTRKKTSRSQETHTYSEVRAEAKHPVSRRQQTGQTERHRPGKHRKIATNQRNADNRPTPPSTKQQKKDRKVRKTAKKERIKRKTAKKV